MRFSIMGPQGCGKTTQAQIISDHFNLCFIKTGSLIREFAKGKSLESQKLRAIMEKGEMVDDALVAVLVSKEIESIHCQNGVVVDGYPRRVSQIKQYDPNYDLVICINISDQEAIKRLLQRGRQDDTPQAIRERLKIYHSETKQVLDYYQHLQKLVVINGEQDTSLVSKQIIKTLMERFNHG